MPDAETVLRRRLDRYLEAIDPSTERVSGVLGMLLTGSLAAGFADEYSDLDLTIVVEGDGSNLDSERLEDALVPEGSNVQRRSPLKKYSFDWEDGHVDVDVITHEELCADHWDLRTRWEYDNAEILIDPSGRLAARLDSEVPFEDGEVRRLAEHHADAFLFVAQWNVQKACLRGAYHVAHRAVTRAIDHGITLLFLRESAFVPRDKWLFEELESLSEVDTETRDLVWTATRVQERDVTDVRRRVRILHHLWERLEPSLVERELLDPETVAWEAPADDLCPDPP